MVERCAAGSYAPAVTRLASGWVVMGERQVLPGYCLLLPDPVVAHLNALGAGERNQFLADMSAWLREGKVKYREDVTEGLENAPRELIGLLRGENFGKKVIRVGPAPARRA